MGKSAFDSVQEVAIPGRFTFPETPFFPNQVVVVGEKCFVVERGEDDDSTESWKYDDDPFL